jgi:hypothetical protein
MRRWGRRVAASIMRDRDTNLAYYARSCRGTPSQQFYAIAEIVMTPPYSDHAIIDARNRSRDEIIAERLRANPDLLQVAKNNIARWHALHGETAPAHQDWSDILNGPLEGVIATLLGRDPTSERLRQSNPFNGIMTQDERRRLNESHSIGTRYSSSKRTG